MEWKIEMSGSSIAPCRDGFYGPVTSTESDSDTSCFYHEPYQQQQQQQQQQPSTYSSNKFHKSLKYSDISEYGCLIQKEPLVLTPKGLHSNGIYHHDQVFKFWINIIRSHSMKLDFIQSYLFLLDPISFDLNRHRLNRWLNFIQFNIDFDWTNVNFNWILIE